MNLNALGALLFGSVLLAFLGALAIVFGGPVEITLIAVAMLCSYLAQLCFYWAETGNNNIGLAGLVFWLVAFVTGVIGAILTVWF